MKAAAVIGVALAVRLLLAGIGAGDPARLLHEPDSSGYLTLARNLADHGRFSLDAAPPLTPDHTRTPAYPALLALLVTLGGPLALAAAMAGAVLGAGTVAALVLGGARIAGPTPALLAGLAVAVDPASAAYSAMVLTEAPFTLLLTLALLAFTAALASGGTGRLALASALLGVASLTRPIGVYLPLALGGAAALGGQRRWRWAAAATLTLLAGTALLTVPWALRNRLTGGGFALSSVPAINLYYHRAGAVVADASGTSREAARQRLRMRLEREAPESRDALMSTWGLQIIRSDPWRYTRLHLQGVLHMLGPDPTPVFQLLGWLGAGGEPPARRLAAWRGILAGEGLLLVALYATALAGVWRAARAGAWWLVAPAVVTIAYALAVGGPEAYSRFRVPLMPCFAWLAGLAAWRPAAEASRG